MGIWKVLINRWSGIWIFWKINIYDRGDEVLKRPLCLAVCIYIAFLVGMRWVSEKDVPDLQAQNTVTILCQLDEIRGMGEKKNFVVSSVVADGKKVCNKLRVFPDDSLKWDQTMEIGNILELTCLLYTSHLIPMNRGILITAYASYKKGVTEEQIRKAYEDAYKDEYFVRVLEPGVCPETKWVEGSNFVDVNVKVDERTHRVIMMGAMDNITKGAAGQAVQNMNIMFGLSEQEGLRLVPMVP